MSPAEEHDEQSPNFIRRRYNPCGCDSAHGDYRPGCPCWDDDGIDATHGGCEVERSEHDRGGYPRRT